MRHRLQSETNETSSARLACLAGRAELAGRVRRLVLDSLPVLRHPRERLVDFHGLRRYLFAKDVLEDSTVHLLDLDHAVRRHQLMRPAHVIRPNAAALAIEGGHRASGIL